MKEISRLDVLSTYIFYGLKEADMVNDLGDAGKYDMETACQKIEDRIMAMHRKSLYGVVH